MTPEGQMCRDMLGELETQWERAGPLVKLQGQAIIPNLLMLVDTLCDRLDAVEKATEATDVVAQAYVGGTEEERAHLRRLGDEMSVLLQGMQKRCAEEHRATAGQCDSLADLEVRHG